MTKALAKREDISVAQTEQMEEILSNIVLKGDISQLKPHEKVQYYNQLCQRIGLDPMTQPFEIVKFQGKEVLYARKGATEQLRALHGISVTAMTTQHLSDCFVVQVTVQNAKGRVDFGTGAVSIANKKGDDLANALMKAETKAKRRATLSICGLGMLDETELETIPDAKPAIDSGLRGAPIGKRTEITGSLNPDQIDPVLQKEMDEHLENVAPKAPAKKETPEPAVSPEAENGTGKPNQSRVTLIEWRDKAKELGKKEAFDKVITKELADRRVKKFEQLAEPARQAVIGKMRMVVESWLPMPEGKKPSKLQEKLEKLAAQE